VLSRVSGSEALRLRELAALFIHEKSMEPVAGLVLTSSMRQTMALQACLPVLNLGLGWLDQLASVVVYPDTFLSEIVEHDEYGVVHNYREARAGESWQQGPLILSWTDVEAGTRIDGYNVVIHEIAHRLDALNGAANGRPPLHRGMAGGVWAEVFTDAFADFVDRVDAGEDTAIDPYASDSPAEFFAVLSESFFEIPCAVASEYPAAYDQLAAFYRQDPASNGFGAQAP